MKFIGAGLYAAAVIKQSNENIGRCLMEQSRYVESLIQRSAGQKEIKDKIQMLYENYIFGKDENVLEELNKYIIIYCRPWVRDHITMIKNYYPGSEEDILQETIISVWNFIEKSPKRISHFAGYCHNICRNRFYDVCRKAKRGGSMLKNTVSLDKTLNDENRNTLGDIISSDEPDTEEKIEQKEKIRLIKKIHSKYCYCFMNSDAFPPSSLALCYARVLPNIKGAINTASSAQWAFEEMQGSTVEKLSIDSGNTIQKNVDGELSWCSSFKQKLNEPIMTENGDVLLKKLVYTSVYGKEKIEDWAEYRHKMTIKAFMDIVVKDTEIWALIQSYLMDMKIFTGAKEKGESSAFIK